MGALAGVLLTRDVDRDLPSQNAGATIPPTVTLFPVRDIGGGTTPAVGAVGFF